METLSRPGPLQDPTCILRCLTARNERFMVRNLRCPLNTRCRRTVNDPLTSEVGMRNLSGVRLIPNAVALSNVCSTPVECVKNEFCSGIEILPNKHTVEGHYTAFDHPYGSDRLTSPIFIAVLGN